MAGGILGVLAFRRDQAAKHQEALEVLNAIADLKTAQITDWRNERKSDANMFSHLPLVMRGLQAIQATPTLRTVSPEVLAILNIPKDANHYRAVALFDGQFRCCGGCDGEVSSAERHADCSRMAEYAVRQRATLLGVLQTGASAVEYLQRDQPDGEIFLRFLAPIFAPPIKGEVARPIGVFMIEVDAAKQFYPLIQSWPTPSRTAETLLVRRDGDEVLFLNELRQIKGTALSLRHSAADADLPAAHALLGKQETMEGKDYRGELVVAALRRIPDSPWFMVAKMDQEEIYAPVRATARLDGWIAGMFLLVMLLGVVLIGRHRTLLTSRTQLAERVRTDAIREDLLRSLQEKTSEMESILYISSHDLRSPLVNIQGFSLQIQQGVDQIQELLEKAADLAAFREAARPILIDQVLDSLNYVIPSATKMDAIIKGILRVSRLGSAVLHPEQLDMNLLLGAVQTAFTYQLQEAKAEVLIEPLPTCWGDSGQVNQVFSNLLDNALKYRNPEHPLRLRIRGEMKGTQAVYCVEDNGLGIPAEYQAKVWDIFCRHQSSDEIPGEGLGLSAIRRILQRHRGRAWVESEPGQGSRFFVAFPTEVEYVKMGSVNPIPV